VDHEYLSIDGLSEFTKVAAALLLGADAPAVRDGRVRVCTLPTPRRPLHMHKFTAVCERASLLTPAAYVCSCLSLSLIHTQCHSVCVRGGGAGGERAGAVWEWGHPPRRRLSLQVSAGRQCVHPEPNLGYADRARMHATDTPPCLSACRCVSVFVCVYGCAACGTDTRPSLYVCMCVCVYLHAVCTFVYLCVYGVCMALHTQIHTHTRTHSLTIYLSIYLCASVRVFAVSVAQPTTGTCFRMRACPFRPTATMMRAR
jgi:hypothetical protein